MMLKLLYSLAASLALTLVCYYDCETEMKKSLKVEITEWPKGLAEMSGEDLEAYRTRVSEKVGNMINALQYECLKWEQPPYCGAKGKSGWPAMHFIPTCRLGVSNIPDSQNACGQTLKLVSFQTDTLLAIEKKLSLESDSLTAVTHLLKGLLHASKCVVGVEEEGPRYHIFKSNITSQFASTDGAVYKFATILFGGPFIFFYELPNYVLWAACDFLPTSVPPIFLILPTVSIVWPVLLLSCYNYYLFAAVVGVLGAL